MSTSTLPDWTRDILAVVPHRGDGLNRWLLRASIALRRAGRSEPEIIEELRCLTAGEPVKAGEIERAAQRSAEYMTDSGLRQTPRSKWAAIDTGRRQEIVKRFNGGTVELWERSPRRFVDGDSHTEEVIDALFPGNPLICVARQQYSAKTATRESFRGWLGVLQFVVPSPMTALTGLNQEGKTSARCLDNTGPRRFLVVEQDSGTADEQAAIIMHLAEQAPLVLVVHSGGKSLHSWFVCGQQPESTLRQFFDAAVKLGADPAMWVRCQLARMPDGSRPQHGENVRQAVLYWNPDIIGAQA